MEKSFTLFVNVCTQDNVIEGFFLQTSLPRHREKVHFIWEVSGYTRLDDLILSFLCLMRIRKKEIPFLSQTTGILVVCVFENLFTSIAMIRDFN